MRTSSTVPVPVRLPQYQHHCPGTSGTVPVPAPWFTPASQPQDRHPHPVPALVPASPVPASPPHAGTGTPSISIPTPTGYQPPDTGISTPPWYRHPQYHHPQQQHPLSHSGHPPPGDPHPRRPRGLPTTLTPYPVQPPLAAAFAPRGRKREEKTTPNYPNPPRSPSLGQHTRVGIAGSPVPAPSLPLGQENHLPPQKYHLWDGKLLAW